MLQQLHVSNLAIVDDLRVEFAPGMNVVTGETGAGKSVLIGALDLVLGARAERDVIRAGEDRCQVEAVFFLPDSAAVDRLLDDAGLPGCEDGGLVLRRTLQAVGPGRAFVNDAPVTVQTLRHLGALLVDMHGPHDRQSLLDPAFQRDLLDAFGRHDALREACRREDATLRSLRARREELSGDPEGLQREADLLRYQIEEIEAAALTGADEDDLVQAHAEAAHAETLLTMGTAVADTLTEADDSAFNRLAQVQHQLSDMAALLPEAESWREETRSAAVQIQSIAQSLTDRIQRIDVDPGRLQQIEERLTLVQKLKRKYGARIDAIQAHLEKARERLDAIDARDRLLTEIDAEMAAARHRLAEACEALSAARRHAAKALAADITTALRDLGFKRSEFDVGLNPADPGPTGADAIEFGFAPNPGEPMRALRAIASSGEISRVMLAIKSVLAAHDRIPVLVFDEIDANIGGVTGDVVGVKMHAIARSHQVVCITHLPQVAAYGDRHLVVSKRFVRQRTLTDIALVSDADRDTELARMLGGENLTPTALDHARALRQRGAKLHDANR